MTSRAQKPLVRGRSHSTNFDFFSFAVWTNVKRKDRQTTKQKNQEHRNIAPLSLKLRSYNEDWQKKQILRVQQLILLQLYYFHKSMQLDYPIYKEMHKKISFSPVKKAGNA